MPDLYQASHDALQKGHPYTSVALLREGCPLLGVTHVNNAVLQYLVRLGKKSFALFSCDTKGKLRATPRFDLGEYDLYHANDWRWVSPLPHKPMSLGCALGFLDIVSVDKRMGVVFNIKDANNPLSRNSRLEAARDTDVKQLIYVSVGEFHIQPVFQLHNGKVEKGATWEIDEAPGASDPVWKFACPAPFEIPLI